MNWNYSSDLPDNGEVVLVVLEDGAWDKGIFWDHIGWKNTSDNDIKVNKWCRPDTTLLEAY